MLKKLQHKTDVTVYNDHSIQFSSPMIRDTCCSLLLLALQCKIILLAIFTINAELHNVLVAIDTNGPQTPLVSSVGHCILN